MKSPKLEEEYHDRVAESFSDIREHDFIWEIPEEFYLLKKDYFENKVVVDVGCGPAISIRKNIDKKVLKKSTYIGIDISKKMLSFSQMNIPDGIFYYADISTLPLERESVDTIISLGALHHVENQSETLKNWINVLKPNGYLLLREPLYEVLKRGTGASPIEEGIKVKTILKILKENKFIICKQIFFASKFFHLVNRFFIKILGNFWENTKALWYPVIILDIFLIKMFSKYTRFLKGEACIIIAQKI